MILSEEGWKTYKICKFLGKNWGQGTCWPQWAWKRTEGRGSSDSGPFREGTGFAFPDGSDESMSFRGKTAGKGLEAVLVLLESYEYPMPRVGAAGEGAGDLSAASQRPGGSRRPPSAQKRPTVDLPPPSPHPSPRDQPISAALMFSQCVCLRVFIVSSWGIQPMIGFTWSAQMWMSLGRTHVIQFAAGSTIPCPESSAQRVKGCTVGSCLPTDLCLVQISSQVTSSSQNPLCC